MFLLLTFFLIQAHANCDVKLLTNQSAAIGHLIVPPFAGSQLGDPATPFTNGQGDVEIYGTGNNFLRYSAAPHLSALESLINADRPQILKLHLAYPDGTLINEGDVDEAPWDTAIQAWPQGDVLYAGVMTPPPGHSHANFDEDNWNRRVFAFRLKHGLWIREKNPLSYPKTDNWVGHSEAKTDKRPFWLLAKVSLGRPGPNLTLL